MAQIKFPENMLLFGCGNMAGAMLKGWLSGGVPADRFTIVKPTDRNLPRGVTHFPDAASTGRRFDTLLIGVKPQKLVALADDIRSLLNPGATIFSILAGIDLESLQELFPGTRPVRLMPNLSVELGLSPLGLWGGDLDSAAKAEIDAMLAPIGMPEWLAKESLMDALAALAGSGPAFVYRFIDALADAGKATGLPDEQADRLAMRMVVGAAQLAAQSEFPPGELARHVASPGGMTAEGLNILDENGALAKLIESTLRAARDRGAEMAQLAKGEK